MKRTLALIPLFFLLISATGQTTRFKPNKYPSLFWEISGNGLKKPSYLFGTMHVSNKMAFFLSDSFYIAIRNADVVALENNPELWQKEMDEYGTPEESAYGGYRKDYESPDMPSGNITEKTLQFDRYEKRLEQALYVQPFILNSLLYRNSYMQSMDFEEDTYLDLYIFQTGKKLGKKVAGVEQYPESMRLMMEASVDAMNEKNKLEKSYDFDPDLAEMKLQEAYRAGNLDWLDTIHKANSESPAFDEKFIYKRNEIQANSIDSILKRNTLFVGVGAAHLPGERGVIELLRKMGYRLRPIYMTKRDNQHKETIDKIRVPVKFQTEKSPDGFFQVEVPGKLYSYDKEDFFSQSHFADMANGSYYMVTRLRTHHRVWGDSEKDVLRKTDSVMYENIPGKILSKTPIDRNGYKGWDIVNRTRSGDVQRSQIYVTPFELIVFKVSGRGEYIRQGEEAKKFFESIRLKEYLAGSGVNWKPSFGGFKADFPHEPYMSINGDRFFEAVDKTSGMQFSVQHLNLTNFEHAGEDAFELQLLKESFGSGEYIDTLLRTEYTRCSGYPSLDAVYRHKQGHLVRTRFIIRGPHVYSLIAQEPMTNIKANINNIRFSPASDRFFQSFSLIPFEYGEVKEFQDSVMNFTVKSPWFPEKKKTIQLAPDYGRKVDDEWALNEFARDNGRVKRYANDSTGESVFVGFNILPRYKEVDDSSFSDLNELPWLENSEDSARQVRYTREFTAKDSSKNWIYHLTDSGSSRMLQMHLRYKNGTYLVVFSQGDTLSTPSPFVRSFFEQLVPADTVKGYNPFTKKSTIFFADIASGDTLTRQKAFNAVEDVEFDSTDLDQLIKTIDGLSWKDKKYLEVKSTMVRKMQEITTPASSDHLRKMYFQVGDTLSLQHTILNTLLSQQTAYAFEQFRTIIRREPPILEAASDENDRYVSYGSYDRSGYDDDDFISTLEDSLALTKTIFPDILPLVNLDDYRKPIMGLLETLIDSNLVKESDYSTYFSKFFLEARHSIRKQKVAEKLKSIQKAASEDDEEEDSYASSYGNNRNGNTELSRYASILLPAYDNNPDVRDFFDQLLSSEDKNLRFRTMAKMIRQGKKVPDTLMAYFAQEEDFSYRLFIFLKNINKTDLFPKKNLSQEKMARSLLVLNQTNGKPDSLVFLKKYWLESRFDTGYIYFYKYKSKKDDAGWKLASVGLMAKDTTEFDMEPDRSKGFYFSPQSSFYRKYIYNNASARYYESDYTDLWDTRLGEDKTLDELIQDRIKRIYYSQHRNSTQYFQDERNPYGYYR